MATLVVTYATDAEVRASYPQIDNAIPVTMINGAQDGSGGSPLTTLNVNSTNNFPYSGELSILDSAGVTATLIYTRHELTVFYLDPSSTANIPDNRIVKASDYIMNELRQRAKGVVDGQLTNPSIPAEMKKEAEIIYTFYSATRSHCDPEVRTWGREALQEYNSYLATTLRAYPPAMRQNVVFLAEDNLSDTEKDILRNGPGVI